MSRRTTAVLAVTALLVSACAAGDVADTSTSSSLITTTTEEATTTSGPTGTPVVVDTDVAMEGLMSIIYLLGQEDIDILAIAVSGTGLVHCEQGVGQVLGILELMGTRDIPVACGPESPLEGFNAFPTSWRVTADQGYGLELPVAQGSSQGSAPELIADFIEESPLPVVIYADGPQTNLAEALRRRPGIAANVEMVYVMGGAIDVPGNAIRNPDAEWNIWVDPVAADEVFRSGMPVTLVPLDATNQTPLSVFHRETLRDHQGTGAAEAVLTMMENSDQLESGGLFFWDQLTAAILVDETYATLEERNLAVVLGGDRSVAGVIEEDANGSSMRVATSIDTARFETDFLSAIAGTDVGPISVDPDFTVSFDGETWTADMPDSLLTGDYVVRLVNTSDQDAGIAVGWLTGDATPADMDAWAGVEQPPWYELQGFVYMTPSSEFVSVVSLTGSEQYVLVGLDLADNDPTRFAVIDVRSSD
jgi:inosine-uridine nucleoside N-ribohydrolase